MSKLPRIRRHSACDEAHAWARRLRLDDPYAKSVLLALAGYVNAEGFCHVSMGRLAEECEISADTVRRRLVVLEQYGVIVRTQQWIDPTGRRSGEGRGKRTTDKIRLRLDVSAEELQLRISSSYCNGISSVPVSDPADESENSNQLIGSSCLPFGQPLHSCQGLISEPEPEPEDSPKSPLSQFASQSEDLLQKFMDAWSDPIEKPTEVRKVWQELNFVEQAEAPDAVRAYNTYLRAIGKKRRIRNAQTFLRERESWASYFRIVQTEVPASTVFEAAGSDAWRARCVFAEIAGEARPVPVDCPEGSGRASMPLPARYADLSCYADIEPASWSFVAAEDVRCQAWCKFLGIEPRVLVVGTRVYELNGRKHDDWPIKKKGLRVPCDWPPANDGSGDVS